MNNNNLFLTIIILIVLLAHSCENENERTGHVKGYIVGFTPCSIQAQNTIGYIIVSENRRDTFQTWNLSGDIYKMPAPVVFAQDTLYKIPESYFQLYWCSPWFPIEAQDEFKIEIIFRDAKDEDRPDYGCFADIIWTNFHRIVVLYATKQ